MDEYFFGLPYVDPVTGQPAGFGNYIVPPDLPSERSIPTRPTPDYEEPWYADSINRAIERAAQVATLEVAGYPPYPQFPTPTPQPPPLPQGQTQQQIATQSSKDTVTFSNTTLMLLVGGFLLFTLGKRGR